MPPSGVEHSRRSASTYYLTTSPKSNQTASATDRPVTRENHARKSLDRESHLKYTSSTSEISRLEGLSPENLTPKKSDYAHSMEGSVSCSYHGPVLQLLPVHNNSDKNLNAMERFMKEGPSDQYALHIRSDNGQLSTSKGCSCPCILEDEDGALVCLGITELDGVYEESFIGI
ncbi:hypothetical protein AOQ84DRAFT_78219 [Glonium stellatum]|uniref:Uncharacterized protein n=1 Tax=Glonium stellatum TaxID=574774 RepID=A0A8E2JR60_9PEZI|nr:hypothetical protein AOQ84DRAFT_78219 [Glonium stellatum]